MAAGEKYLTQSEMMFLPAGTNDNSAELRGVSGNTIVGKQCVVEGNNNYVIGDYSHVEGQGWDESPVGAETWDIKKLTASQIQAVNAEYGTNFNGNVYCSPYSSASLEGTVPYIATEESDSDIYANITRKVYDEYSIVATHSLIFATDRELTGVTTSGFSSRWVGYLDYPAAAGFNSHKEGQYTSAQGDCSHAEGYYTRARGKSEHAEGQYNKSNYASRTFGNSGNTIHSVGIGTSIGAGKNAFEIMQNGDAYLYGVGGYDGTNASVSTSSTLQKCVGKMEEITWSNLKSLRDSSGLTPGMQYRITDYNTTTSQANTQSAGHQFDIIVTADDNHTLNENARAARHSGDTYFSGCTLEAWELKYDIDNDADKYAWAVTGSTGRGVIYYMKDEWNNECPYDFKNIQFARWEQTSPVGYIYDEDEGDYVEDSDQSWVSGYNLKVGFYSTNGSSNGVLLSYDEDIGDYKKIISYTVSSTPTYCYTFGRGLDGTLGKRVYSNVIKGYYSSNKLQLNNIVFLQPKLTHDCYSNTFGNGCYSNTFGSGCNSNTFGNSCTYNTFGNNCTNTFGDSCDDNTFGNSCTYNTFGDSCGSNIFGNSCRSNTFGNYCTYNTFGNYCTYNTFGNYCTNTFGQSCTYNTFGNYCIYNTFGSSCTYNTFGNCYNYNTFGFSCGNNTFGNSCGNNTFGGACNSNTFGNSCGYNTFGDSCGSNTFGNDCNFNTFGNSCGSNTFGESVQYFITGNVTGATTSAQTSNYIQYLIVENGVLLVNAYCTGTTSSSNYCQNIKIGLGVKGTSPSNRKQIDITSCIGSTVCTVYQPTNSKTISV